MNSFHGKGCAGLDMKDPKEQRTAVESGISLTNCFPFPDKLDANLAEKGVGAEEGKGRALLGMKVEKHLIDRAYECTRINFPLRRGTRPGDRH